VVYLPPSPLGGDGGIDLRLPILERLVEACHHRLESSNALLALLSRLVDLSKTGSDGDLLGSEP
jgi:hypothetical protein